MFNEPPVAPDDTRPTMTFPAVDLNARPIPFWQRLFGLVMLLAAFGFTAATVMLLTTPVEQTVIIVTSTPTQPEVVNLEPTALPTTDEVVEAAATQEQRPISVGALPTLSVDAQVSLLQTPVSSRSGNLNLRVVRDTRQPFTIIPDRPRNMVEQYEIQKGDTISDIAGRFGLTQETIAWSNDRRIIWVLTVGAKLNILPVDGVYHQAVGNATIQDIANLYNVADPMTIIDSPFNNLFGLQPNSIPPSGTWIVIPGGTAEAINFSPRVETVSSGGGGSGSGGSGQVAFDTSSPGSCGPQDPGVSTGWQRPLNFYTFMRGFSSIHAGVDLAASIGTPVAAANSGRVIFAGRSNWGFGNLVVLSHGPFVSLYGHLNTVNVSCGQVVSAGQTIGASGNTGNSSGPHLHFEIQYNGVPTNPTDILPF